MEFAEYFMRADVSEISQQILAIRVQVHMASRERERVSNFDNVTRLESSWGSSSLSLANFCSICGLRNRAFTLDRADN